VLDPGLDVQVEKLRAMGEPALAFSGEGQQTSLNPAKCPLAIDWQPAVAAQGLTWYHADETVPSSGTAA